MDGRRTQLIPTQFDPGNRHSVSDPIDLLNPSAPTVGGVGTTAVGASGSAPRVDPFPFQNGPGSPEQARHDPFAHAPMQMPDPNDYTGYGSSYAQNMEGGYGVAAEMGAGAVGAGAVGAGAYAAGHDHDDQSHQGGGYGDPRSGSGNSPPLPSLSSAAAAKHREVAAERQRLRMSAGYDQQPQAGGSGNRPTSWEGRSSTGDETTNGGAGSTVYQHTDYASIPEDETQEAPAEIPPK